MILGLYPATQSSTPRMLCSAGTSRLVPLRFKSIQKLAWFAGIAASAAGAEPIYHSTYTGKPPDEPAMLGLAMNELFVPLAHRARSAVAPAARPGRRVRGSCGTRPLRPPASLLHNAALPSVSASRCAKAPLGAGHRCAPLWLSRHRSIGQALRAVCLVSGLRPVILCVPRPLCGLAAARLWPALVCRSAPKELSQPSALVVGFATNLVAAHARNTGATGRNGL